jgi:hypothetical protein
LTEIVNNGTMKKAFLFWTMLLAVVRVFSQDYQCIRDNATYFYSDGTYIKAIRIDSVVNTVDGLIYYNYPTLSWDDDLDCYNRYSPSWIGRKVLVKPNGDNIFYNKNNEPITIKTHNNIGESWNFFMDIQATVVDIQNMGFLGLIDSVKTISISYKKSHGENGKQAEEMFLLLSKNYGLIETLNFKLFPDMTEELFIYNEFCTSFELVGISDPQVGIKNLTRDMVYDVNVGDEIDTYRQLNGIGGYYEESKYKKHFLQKEYSPSIDTVTYMIRKCGWTMKIIPYSGTYYNYFHDTIFASYYIGYDPIINALPNEVVPSADIDFSVVIAAYHDGTGKLLKTEWPDFFPCNYVTDSCLCVFESKDIKEIGSDIKYYYESLGSYFFHTNVNDGTEWSEPVYYESANITWGTPYSFNCEDFITSDNKISDSPNEVLLSPNPMAEWSKLTFENPENKEYQFQLYNSLGMLVRENQFRTSELIIQRENLNNGIYFYFLTDGKKVVKTGKLVIN